MFTEEIKSRFITLLQHTDGVDEAKQFIQSVKDEYPDARTIAGHLLRASG